MRWPRHFLLLLALALLGSSVLAACETGPFASVTSTPTRTLLSPDVIALQVGNAYGEPHPQILQVKSDVSEAPPHEPMYLMSISGHFHKGTLEAVTLGFSATATRMYVWAIRGLDQAGNEVWLDDELAPATP
jgi:hypothetical protein